jgi:RHH-type proline utilization regulon transcriptional repressor/proline dehydrogenase/delta 1-pyrroline-5-carboxylate dehydrogenase
MADELRSSEFLHPSRDEIAAYHLTDEDRLVADLIARAASSPDEQRRVDDLARRLVHAARMGRRQHGGVDAFMHEYGLSSEEGVILMCLAEALLRIPDSRTADALIADRVAEGQWDRHLGNSQSLFVNASTWGLMLTGRVVRLKPGGGFDPGNLMKRLVQRSGKPMIREAMRYAMRIMGDQFVLGQTIELALGRAEAYEAKGYRFSYDMLGEAARTQADAIRYQERYLHATEKVGQAAGKPREAGFERLMARPGMSVKLSAIHPRFEPAKENRVIAEAVPRLVELCRLAKRHQLSITIDAEEADRLDLTLAVLAEASVHPDLENWHGLGIAVQAYSRRALPLLRWLKRLSDASRRRIPVRLVKGAYWDSEIKWAQERGLADYPVFTRKVNTDVSYLASMRFLLAEPAAFYPQFATHNAHTVASIYTAGRGTSFEFQRLHGMGQAIYEEVVGADKLDRPCRIYAPVGGHEDLLAYLVRRLLENGANTSFVSRLADDEAPIAEIIRDPVAAAERNVPHRNTQIPAPSDVFRPARLNSLGLPLYERSVREPLQEKIRNALLAPITAGPIVGGKTIAGGETQDVLSPTDRRIKVGTVREATPADIDEALRQARAAHHAWDMRGGDDRASILIKAADRLEQSRAPLMAAMIREAGKTLDNAQGDLREAADFLRYYANEARSYYGDPLELPGTTGERNVLTLHGRGVFCCISPWNFPLAIFVGQIAAALAAGNTVVAKPAEQTPLTAFLATRILHEAGIPGDVLHLLPGDGRVGARLTGDKRVDGVAFTGSNETAWAIQRSLAERRGAIVPFIAETGGINAMIADTSALPEQVVRDVVRSAFDSAGQRCSAARVLFIQEEAADRTIEMLAGAMDELTVGDPMLYSTDVGPVIDEAAQRALEAHKRNMQGKARTIRDLSAPHDCIFGTFVTPAAYAIERLDVLDREVFGPVLHVVRYAGDRLGEVIEAINATGYGLTLGLHSRISATHDFVARHAKVGNLYINRNQIGAVVGMQPFGGEGLSGTGPKAGGPFTLPRFGIERVRSTDVTASGGNTALLGLGEGGSGAA